jgi:ammonia channel protein AmtB
MTTLERPALPGTAQALAWALTTLAAAAGAYLSFGFGMRIGGALMGVVAALNGALMGLLMAAAACDLAARWRRREGAPRS